MSENLNTASMHVRVWECVLKTEYRVMVHILPSLCPLSHSICWLCSGLRKGGGRGEVMRREKQWFLFMSCCLSLEEDGFNSVISSFCLLLTFQVRLQGTVGETLSRDPRYQMVFRQWFSIRTGTKQDAATFLRNAEDNVLRQLSNTVWWLLFVPGAGSRSSLCQWLWGLRCPGPSVPPPACLPVGDPSGCGFVPALRLFLAVSGQ